MYYYAVLDISIRVCIALKLFFTVLDTLKSVSV